ncbi:MAG: hypothetical protein WCQ26_07550 [Pseudanabaena sp. ELA748]
MQDFWLINGFFLMLGLIYIIISLIFIFSAKRLNPKTRSQLTGKAINAIIAKKRSGYKLLITGLLISSIATLILIFGQSTNLLMLTAINLTVTFFAHLFHTVERDPMPIPNNENPDLADDAVIVELNGQISVPSEPPTGFSETNDLTEIINPSDGKYSINISPEIFAELMEISSDPTSAVDEAIRWWLRRRLVDNNSTSTSRRSLRSNESWRSQQQQNWND